MIEWNPLIWYRMICFFLQWFDGLTFAFGHLVEHVIHVVEHDFHYTQIGV